LRGTSRGVKPCSSRAALHRLFERRFAVENDGGILHNRGADRFHGTSPVYKRIEEPAALPHNA
jgi:hypothetical protein